MSPLRKKMIEAMSMRGFSVRTHETYLMAVRELARHHRRCPSTLERTDIEAFFRHLVLERQVAPATCRVYLNAIRFVYVEVLEAAFDIKVKIPKKPQRIPQLLTRAEVARIIAHSSNPKRHAMLCTCYGCGLRVSELTALRVGDIDGERALLRVTQGKGAKDRAVIMGTSLLRELRSYWQLYRPSAWLFPGRRPDMRLSDTSAQRAFTGAKAKAGVTKVGGIHSLRHAYATHQLEGGLPVHILQRLLGHQSIQATLRYVHWLPSYRDAGAQHSDLVATLERRS